jgi:epoxyqueuosine reductase
MNTHITEAQFNDLLPECCRIGFASIGDYQGAERSRIVEQMPSAQSVIVIAHHVQDSLEWTWFKFPAARNGETSPADMHCLAMAERVSNRLCANGAQCLILPYPGICGLMFKTIALPTGLGLLGDNFLFMNEEWGPWIHLRILLTDAAVDHTRRQATDACTHCGKCIQACPAHVFRAGTFNGLACRDKMREMSKTESDRSFCFECELCLRACPVGRQPKEIRVRFKD